MLNGFYCCKLSTINKLLIIIIKDVWKWQLCTKETDDVESIAPVFACRPIPLAKTPGVPSIGIEEVSGADLGILGS